MQSCGNLFISKIVTGRQNARPPDRHMDRQRVEKHTDKNIKLDRQTNRQAGGQGAKQILRYRLVHGAVIVPSKHALKWSGASWNHK